MFSYNYRWAILNRLGFSAPLEICREDTIKITSDYFHSGRKLTKSDAQKCGYFLHTLVKKDNKDALKLLINHGVDVNAKDDDAGTPLHNAVWEQNKEIVELLINHGADVNAKSISGTPLYVAKQLKACATCSVNKVRLQETIQLLRKHGAR